MAKLGFDILEISCGALKETYTTDQQLSELRKYAENKNIILTAGYGPALTENLGSTDPEIQKNAIAFFTKTIQDLEKLGIKTFGGGLYSYWPVDYTKPIDKAGDLERSIKNMKEIAKVAEACDEAIAYVDAVGSSHVKVMLDTFHMNIEEDDMAEAILLAGDKLGHFHVGENNRRLPGKGGMPWYQIGSALRAIGYDRNIVMEPFVKSGGGVGSDIKVWRDLSNGASTKMLDADAAASVAYLRNVFSGPNSDYASVLRG